MQATVSSGEPAPLRPPHAVGLPLVIAGVVSILLIAALFFTTLQSMNRKLGALDQMMDTLGRMDRRLAETNQQLVAANHALTTTNERLAKNVKLAVSGNQSLEKTNAALSDMDAQITQLTKAISRSHVLKI
jgi:methyl-accepting chemotaxis protein